MAILVTIFVALFIFIPAILFWFAVCLKIVTDAQEKKRQEWHEDDGK